MKRLMLLAFTLFPFNSAMAADLCKAVALRDVPTVNMDMTPKESQYTSVLRRGEVDYAVTMYLVNRRTGVAGFCSHGGSCYPTHLQLDGKKVEVLRLTNCKISKVGSSDKYLRDVTGYEVIVDRSKNSAEDLRMDDLDNKFLRMGLCSACADNVAQWYIKQPYSRCGKLAKQALGGNADAKQLLATFPSYCTWKY